MGDENNKIDLFGRKVFFLHPSALVQNEIIPELAQEEFEVYSVKNTDTFRAAIKKIPNPVIFANIDDGMPENEWEAYIRKLMAQAENSGIDIGILSTTSDDTIQRKYVNTVKVSCGFVHIKQDIAKPIKQIRDILNAGNAKGRRKYIRAVTESDANTTINIPHNNGYINGHIQDISIVGLSCTFTSDPELVKNSYFQNMQIKLHSVLLKVEAVVFGSRMEGNDKVYVLVFTQKVDPDTRSRIRKFIQTSLQSRMDAELKRGSSANFD